MTPRRKKIVTRLREEGKQAFKDGRHIQTNPYQYMDAYQWLRGYREAALDSFYQFELTLDN